MSHNSGIKSLLGQTHAGSSAATKQHTEKPFGRWIRDCEGAEVNAAGLRAMMATPGPSWK